MLNLPFMLKRLRSFRGSLRFAVMATLFLVRLVLLSAICQRRFVQLVEQLHVEGPFLALPFVHHIDLPRREQLQILIGHFRKMPVLWTGIGVLRPVSLKLHRPTMVHDGRPEPLLHVSHLDAILVRVWLFESTHKDLRDFIHHGRKIAVGQDRSNERRCDLAISHQLPQRLRKIQQPQHVRDLALLHTNRFADFFLSQTVSIHQPLQCLSLLDWR